MKVHISMLWMSSKLVVGTIVGTILAVAVIAWFCQWRVDINITKQEIAHQVVAAYDN